MKKIIKKIVLVVILHFFYNLNKKYDDFNLSNFNKSKFNIKKLKKILLIILMFRKQTIN